MTMAMAVVIAGLRLIGGRARATARREDCGEDGEETPGELQEDEFGGVVPDECGEGGEEEGDGDGEDRERDEEGSDWLMHVLPPFAMRLRRMGHPGFLG